jgi:hypothetical protein
MGKGSEEDREGEWRVWVREMLRTWWCRLTAFPTPCLPPLSLPLCWLCRYLKILYETGKAGSGSSGSGSAFSRPSGNSLLDATEVQHRREHFHQGGQQQASSTAATAAAAAVIAAASRRPSSAPRSRPVASAMPRASSAAPLVPRSAMLASSQRAEHEQQRQGAAARAALADPELLLAMRLKSAAVLSPHALINSYMAEAGDMLSGGHAKSGNGGGGGSGGKRVLSSTAAAQSIYGRASSANRKPTRQEGR